VQRWSTEEACETYFLCEACTSCLGALPEDVIQNITKVKDISGLASYRLVKSVVLSLSNLAHAALEDMNSSHTAGTAMLQLKLRNARRHVTNERTHLDAVMRLRSSTKKVVKAEKVLFLACVDSYFREMESGGSHELDMDHGLYHRILPKLADI
jgi:hypothetical protein